MGFILLALSGLCSAMMRRYPLDCVNLQGKSQNYKERYFSDKNIPLLIFKPIGEAEVDIRKYLEIQIHSDILGYFTLGYDSSDPVIDKQFSFHVEISKYLKRNGLLPFDTTCLIDDDYSYIAFEKQRPHASSSVTTINDANLLNMKVNYLRLLTQFENLEKKDVVLNNFDDALKLLSNKGIMQFEPIDIAYVYRANDKGYLSTKNVFVNKGSESTPKFDAKTKGGEKFVEVTVESSWLRYYFTRVIAGRQENIKRNNIPEKEKNLMLSFIQRIKQMNSQVGLTRTVGYSWDDLRSLIANWGDGTSSSVSNQGSSAGTNHEENKSRRRSPKRQISINSDVPAQSVKHHKRSNNIN